MQTSLVEMFLNKCYEAINCASKWPPAPGYRRVLYIPLPQKKRKRLKILPYTVKIDGCGASYDAALEWPMNTMSEI